MYMYLVEVFDVDFEWFQNHHGSLSMAVEIGSDVSIQHGRVNDHLSAGETEPGHKGVDRFRGKTPSPEGGQGEEPGVIPVGADAP